MKFSNAFIFLSCCLMLLTACGGGNSLPAGATLSISTAGIKQLQFSWTPVEGVTSYRLLVNPDGASGYQQIGEDIAASKSSLLTVISISLGSSV